MEIGFWAIVVIAIILSIALIAMVLLQPSKGGGIGSAFGTLGTQLGSTFGSRRTLDFLAKGTTWTAGALAVLCILANLFFIPKATGPVPVTQGAATSVPQVPQGLPSAPGAPATGAPATGAPATGGAEGQQAPAQQNAAPTPSEQAPADNK